MKPKLCKHGLSKWARTSSGRKPNTCDECRRAAWRRYKEARKRALQSGTFTGASRKLCKHGLSVFTRDPATRCGVCRAAYRKKWHQTIGRQRAREWRKRNRDKVAASNRRYYARYRRVLLERGRAWRSIPANRAKKAQATRAWRISNPHLHNAGNRRWRLKHQEWCRKYDIAYRRKHQARLRAKKFRNDRWRRVAAVPRPVRSLRAKLYDVRAEMYGSTKHPGRGPIRQRKNLA